MNSSGNEEVINQFVMTAKDFHIHQTLNTPIYLDPQNYNYYLRLLQVQFSNVVPNVTENLYVNIGSLTLVCGVGVYEINDLITMFNNLGVGKLELSNYDGKITYKNDTGGNITFSSTGNNFLVSNIIGFDSTQIEGVTVLNSGTIKANNPVVIEEFNYFVLSSGNIQGITLTSFDETQLKPSNILYPFSSALSPFQFKTWTAIQPVEFLITYDCINFMDFELKDAMDRPITVLMAQSDFMVTCQIVKKKKIR